MRTGIFGGSFDPVHNDHINILKRFIIELNLDRVIVLPAHISPFKNDTKSSGEDRLNMLKLACLPLKNVVVDNREIMAQGKSYTYKTILQLKEENKQDELFLLIGADNLENFHKWKNPQIIFENCNVVCAGRGGYDFKMAVEVFLENNKNANLTTFDFDGKISSSYVRQLLMLGVYDENYLPKNVIDYIKANNLYAGDKYYDYVKNALKLPRIYHTAGVIVTCEKYAKMMGEDVEKARLAGLLHDVAKYMDASLYKDLQLPLGVVPNIVHQYLGAYVAKNILKVCDEDILNAINYHTTGRPNMSNLEKIVFTADLLEPTRNYGEVEELRKVVEEDFEKGFRLCIARSIEHLKRENQPIFNLTIETAKFYNVIK